MRVLIVLMLAVALAACVEPGSAVDGSELPNPASVYCEEQGGDVEIRTDADGEEGHLERPRAWD